MLADALVFRAQGWTRGRQVSIEWGESGEVSVAYTLEYIFCEDLRNHVVLRGHARTSKGVGGKNLGG